LRFETGSSDSQATSVGRLSTSPALSADLLDAGQVDRVVAMDSEEPVGREFFEKSAEGTNVSETAFGWQANQRVVPHVSKK